jgi:hypothetical protein
MDDRTRTIAALQPQSLVTLENSRHGASARSGRRSQTAAVELEVAASGQRSSIGRSVPFRNAGVISSSVSALPARFPNR